MNATLTNMTFLAPSFSTKEYLIVDFKNKQILNKYADEWERRTKQHSHYLIPHFGKNKKNEK